MSNKKTYNYRIRPRGTRTSRATKGGDEPFKPDSLPEEKLPEEKEKYSSEIKEVLPTETNVTEESNATSKTTLTPTKPDCVPKKPWWKFWAGKRSGKRTMKKRCYKNKSYKRKSSSRRNK